MKRNALANCRIYSLPNVKRWSRFASLIVNGLKFRSLLSILKNSIEPTLRLSLIGTSGADDNLCAKVVLPHRRARQSGKHAGLADVRQRIGDWPCSGVESCPRACPAIPAIVAVNGA